MARSRPVTKFKSYTKQSLVNFKGSNNQGRIASRLLINLRQAILSLTGSAIFVTPSPSIADLTTTSDTLASAIQQMGVKGNRGGRTLQLSLAQAMEEANIMLNQLSGYVNSVVNATFPTASKITRVNTLLSSGMVPRIQGRNNVTINTPNRGFIQNSIPPAPSNFRSPYSKHTIAGQTRLRWKKVKGAVAYQVWADIATRPTLVAIVTQAFFTTMSGPGLINQYYIIAVGKFGTLSPRSQTLTTYAASANS